MEQVTKVDTLTLANVKARLNSDTPPIFKTLGRILTGIGTIGAGVIAVTIGLPATIPTVITTIAIAMVAVGGVGRALTALTSTTPPPQPTNSQIQNP